MTRGTRTALVVVVGFITVAASSAWAAPAEVDATFGDDGVAIVPLHSGDGGTVHLADVLASPDGSSIVLGGVFDGEPFGSVAPDFDLAVARLRPDGSLDTDFGDGGRTQIDLGDFDLPGKLDTDADGRIVFTGNRYSDGRTTAFSGRLTATGELDVTFGDGGLVDLGDGAQSAAGGVSVDDLGRASVATTFGVDGGTDEEATAAVVRLRPDGTFDPEFGQQGVSSVAAVGSAALDVVATDDGGLAVAGIVGGDRAMAALLDAGGEPVSSFGAGGIATVPVPSSFGVTAVATGDRGVLIGGIVGQQTGLLARFDERGGIDHRFGVEGVRTVRGPRGTALPTLAAELLPNGTLVLTGPEQDLSPRALVMRLLDSGLEDTGFGGDGIVHPTDGRSFELSIGSALTVADDGRVIVAGVAAGDEGAHGFAARLRDLPPGEPPGPGLALRVAGADRVATAIALSQSVFAAAGEDADRNATGAVIAAADRFPDALVAAPFAAGRGAPLLTTSGDQLDPRVRAELSRLLLPGSTVTIMGGYSAVSVIVESDLRGAGYDVQRIGGRDRYETSVLVAETVPASAVLLARGDDFPDALTAGPAAAEIRAAVLLTNGRTLPPPVAAYLDQHPDLSRYAVGGHAAAAAPDAEPIVGADRYDTAARVAIRFFHTPARTVVASGEGFPDALAGGTTAALTGGPLLLSPSQELPASAAEVLRRSLRFHRVVTLAGGRAVLGDQVQADVQAALAP